MYIQYELSEYEPYHRLSIPDHLKSYSHLSKFFSIIYFNDENCVLKSQDIQVFVLTFVHVEKTAWLER